MARTAAMRLFILCVCIAATLYGQMPIDGTQMSIASNIFDSSGNIILGPNTINLQGLVQTQTISNSNISNPMFNLTRTDNSPATSGAGILNGYYAPASIYRLNAQSGTATGALGTALFYMPSVSALDWTSITQDITLNASPQAVTVANALAFATVTLPVAVTIDLARGSAFTESVSVTAIDTGANTITAIFTKNHTTGAKIGVSAFDKINVGIAINDVAANSANLVAINTNVIGNSILPNYYNGNECDSTNRTGSVPGNYNGDTTPLFACYTAVIGSNATNNSTSAYTAGTSSATKAWLNGYVAEGTVNNGFLITRGPITNGPVNGLNIQAAQTYGIIIGSHQTAATTPTTVLQNPATAAIFLTAKGASGSVTSGKLRFEGLSSGASETMDLYKNSGTNAGLLLNFNDVWTGLSLGFDGSVATQAKLSIRDSTNTEIGTFTNSTGVSILTSNKIKSSGTAVTVTSGFGTSPSIAGVDQSFRVTLGNPVGTSGIVDLKNTWTHAPVFNCQDETTNASVRATPTTSQVTLTQNAGTWVAADVISCTASAY